MLDLLLLATMFLICGGVGLPIAQLLPARFNGRLLLAPALGMAVLGVAVPILYSAGSSLRAFFFAALLLAVALVAWRARPTMRGLAVDERRWIAVAGGVCVLATLVMLAPRWIGGDQFAVFQGNQWDTFGYLGSAVVYARKPFAFLQTITDEQTTRAPIVAMATAQLSNRPSAAQLYAVFTRLAPGEAYRLYYPFLVFSFVQLVQVTIFVLRNAFPNMTRGAAFAIALVFPLGFWGQYVLDINAWSHITSLPLLFLIFGLAVHVLARPETELRAAVRIAGVLAIAVAGAAYLYPEGLLIYVAAIGPVAFVILVARIVRARRLVLAPIVPLFGFAGAVSIFLYGPQLAFVMRQVEFGSAIKVTWWEFFQAFFYGRDGKLSHGFALVADFAAGLFGLFFATPARGAGMALGTAHRIAIVIVILSLLAGVGALLANKLRADREERLHAALWTAVTLVAFIPALRLALDANYWPAGKLVSFIAPLFITLFCIPAGFAGRHAAWPWIRGIIVVFVVFQLLTAVGRIHAAKTPSGIHYAPPYPSVQAIELKRDWRWDLRPLEALTTDTKVLVRPMDVWMQGYLTIFLYARRVPFVLDGTVNSYFGSGRDLPALPPPWTPDAEITVANREIVVTFRDGRPPLRVVSDGHLK